VTIKSKARSSSVGIVSMAHCLPPQTRLVEDVCQEEGIEFDSKIKADIGIEKVHVFSGQWRSDLALDAAKECLLRANLKATDIDMIVDFSVLPQDYVVPSWCMSNKIQHELGAKKAFNLGFGSGGTSNLLVALKFAASLIKADEDVNTALLIASDVAIPGNRVINPDNPLTVLGDGASALIVTEGSGICEILQTELLSEGNLHDVSYIPGGGIAYPDRLDLYQLRVSQEKYSSNLALAKLKEVIDRVTQSAGINLKECANFISTNISAKDQSHFSNFFGLSNGDPFKENRSRYGHVQATDFVINLSQVLENRKGSERELGLVCSHGWGFLSGAMLIKC
jgi:3-oxoacyl-[acyl-carrier-protein] synthase-3